jgi:hypothetical protein
MTLAIDGRTLRAVRPQLERAIAKARQQWPAVSLQLLERPIPSAAAQSNPSTAWSAPSKSTCVAAGSNASGGTSKGCSSSSGSHSSAGVAAPPAPATALLRISGTQQDQVLAARQLLESDFAGRVF